MQSKPIAPRLGVWGRGIKMARITINTKDEGAMEFWVNDDGGYVRLELSGRPGTLGKQICEGGGFMGNTLSANEANLAQVARRWNRQRRESARS